MQMSLFNFLFFLYFSPIFLIYLLFCFTLPMIRLGEIKKGKGVIAYITKDLIHTDLIFESKDWQDLFESREKYIKIGWGDRKIFLETKEWKDLTIYNFLSAFFGLNKTCLRVDFLQTVPDSAKKIEMDLNQLKIIKYYVGDSYNKKLINKIPIYYQQGDYYESHLRYNCITNCNNWINRALFIARVTNRIWCPINFWFHLEK